MTTENSPPISGVISMLTNCRGSGTGAFALAWMSRDMKLSVLLRRRPRIQGAAHKTKVYWEL